MERRDYGDGGVRERKNAAGDVTGYQVTLRLPDGRRYYTAKTLREARTWLRQAKADAARGTLAAKRPPTFGAYLTDWVEGLEGKVKSRTIAAYRLNVQRVPDSLNSLRLDELRPRHFQRFYDDLAKERAPRTVRQVHMTLHKALEDARRLEVTGTNPTDATTLPRVPQVESHWYTTEQMARLFGATQGDRFQALWLVLGTLGLRLGEALGLRWTDIDWTRHTIAVQRALHRDRLTGKLELQEPKTRRSVRTLSLPTETARALFAHKDRQDLEKRAQQKRGVWQESGLVFCTSIGTPLDQQRIHYNWRRACEKAGLPTYRIHDLRHSVASNLIAGGMGPLAVARMLGHSNGTMVTQVYGHVAPEDHERAAALMDALLERSRAAAV